jgi:nucleotide-binding universal stress UspA family protein
MSPGSPRSEDVRGGVFRRILVGFDGSNEAHHALRVGAALAADLDGQVQVLLVVRPGAHAETPDELERATEATRATLASTLSEVWGEPQRGRQIAPAVVFSDDPAEAIAHHVREHGFDLVVVGDHGRERAIHRGIGRSLQALLRHHPCPVLVV